jgi:hypothetical protein
MLISFFLYLIKNLKKIVSASACLRIYSGLVNYFIADICSYHLS